MRNASTGWAAARAASNASGPRARMSAGSSPAGSATMRTRRPLRSAISMPRSAASWPAASASKHSSTASARRRSSRTPSSVSDVPIAATASSKPAACSAITSV